MSKLREMTQEEAYEKIKELAPVYYKKRKKDLIVRFMLMMVVLSVYMGLVHWLSENPLLILPVLFLGVYFVMQCVACLFDCRMFRQFMADKVPMVDPVETPDWVVMLRKMKQPVLVEEEEEV